MIAILDAAYAKRASAAACVTAADWTSPDPLAQFTHGDGPAADYEPGAFWRRELPLLLSVLNMTPERPDALLIDGYVFLDGDGREGLGAHLFAALGGTTPVVGLAKTRFSDADAWAARIRRQSTLRPLYVTAVGIALGDAAEAVASMPGARLPDLCRLADQTARAALSRVKEKRP